MLTTGPTGTTEATATTATNTPDCAPDRESGTTTEPHPAASLRGIPIRPRWGGSLLTRAFDLLCWWPKAASKLIRGENPATVPTVDAAEAPAGAVAAEEPVLARLTDGTQPGAAV